MQTRQVPEYLTNEYCAKSNAYCVFVFVINEGERLLLQLEKMRSICQGIADVVIADGGSKDGSTDPDKLKAFGVNTLLVKTGPGKLGSQMRMAFDWALNRGYQGVVCVDGNGKDGIEAIPNFIAELQNGVDHVQGSRFIPGGHHENTPKLRYWGVKLLHAPLISLASGYHYTDTTNGFRAYSAKLLSSGKLDIFRDCFDGYELHYYLAVESVKNGFACKEIPVSRVYPAHGKVPTKISPFKGNLNVIEKLLNVVSGEYCHRVENKVSYLLIAINILVFCSMYLTALISPLRLNTDAIRLFYIAFPAVIGEAYGVDQFPIIYPMLLKQLISWNMCNNYTLVGLNLISLLIGYTFIFLFFRRLNVEKNKIFLVILLIQLFYIVIKDVYVPVADILYFSIFWIIVYILQRFIESKKTTAQILYLISLCGFLYLGLNLRSMVVAFIPVAGIVVVLKYHQLIKKYLLFFIVLSVLCVLATLAILYHINFFAHGGYFSSMISKYVSINTDLVMVIVSHPFIELFSCFTNITPNKIPRFISFVFGIGVFIFYCGGAVFCSIKTRNILLALIGVFFLAMLWLWPYVVVRYWLYFTPVLYYWTLELFSLIKTRQKTLLLYIYITLFSMVGMFAFLIVFKGTLAGRDFGENYGNGDLRYAYRCAFKNGKEYEPELENNLVVFILKRFDIFYGTGNDLKMPKECILKMK